VAIDPFADPQDDQLVVATPELITFGYQLAGPGSRFLAQLIDFPLQLVILAAAIYAAVYLGGATGSDQAVFTAIVIAIFIVVWAYYPVCEAAWSGKTPGKAVFGLRVVGDQGEPVRFSQVMIRNLVRIVDFLPVLYGVGIVCLFWNGRGKRLGDMAAGTVVVRERAPVRLSQLRGSGGEPAAGRLAPAESALLRQLEPELRRFVNGYATRRPALDAWRRRVLAGRIEPVLQRELPELVAARGADGALEHLADLATRESAN
jgi:uncharacterized RDD family membrane protein YckC